MATLTERLKNEHAKRRADAARVYWTGLAKDASGKELKAGDVEAIAAAADVLGYDDDTTAQHLEQMRAARSLSDVSAQHEEAIGDMQVAQAALNDASANMTTTAERLRKELETAQGTKDRAVHRVDELRQRKQAAEQAQRNLRQAGAPELAFTA